MNRDEYLLSKALYLGIKQLSKEVLVFTKDTNTKEDLYDMQNLYTSRYNTYTPVNGWEELYSGDEIKHPPAMESHLSTQLDPTGGYYGT